jgi:Fe-S-cluster containining protein
MDDGRFNDALSRAVQDAAARPGVAEAVAGERNVTQWDGRGCPFQVGKLCGVHAVRPFGCRVFFCDPSSTRWLQEAYERFHERLKRLHDELGVAYFYVEWRQALAAVMGIVPTPVEPQTPL